MGWKDEKELWFAKGWATLSFGCELDPWVKMNDCERTEHKWMRPALDVGPNASGGAMYWLTGTLPATCRIWLRAISFFASMQLKEKTNLERICMENHRDMCIDLTGSGDEIDLEKPRSMKEQQIWIAGMYAMARRWGWSREDFKETLKRL